MRKARNLLSAIAAISLLAGFIGVASAATPGYAIYEFQISAHNVSKSLTVNETVTQTSKVGFDKLLLSVTTPTSNFTYSRLVNSSSMLQPFLPTVTNQTFSYATNRTSISVKLTQNGSAPVTFQGSSYTLVSYSFSAEYSLRNFTGNAKGSLFTFPSGLIYSLREVFNGASTLVVTLKSTSLPLTVGAAAPGVQIASVGLGAGVAASAVVIGLGVQIRRRKNRVIDKKPEYWVD